MLPKNSIARIREMLVDDFLMHDHCRGAEVVIKKHFLAYNTDDEITVMARQVEQLMSLLMEDCIILIAAAAARAKILDLINKRIHVSEYQANRILTIAELRWIRQGEF